MWITICIILNLSMHSVIIKYLVLNRCVLSYLGNWVNLSWMDLTHLGKLTELIKLINLSNLIWLLLVLLLIWLKLGLRDMR